MFIEYLQGDSFVHRLDVRTKILGFIAITLLSFLFQDPRYNGVIALFAGGLAVSSHIPWIKMKRMLSPMLPIFISIFIITGFTYQPERFSNAFSQSILFYAWPGHHLGVTIGGVLLGLTFLLRLSSLIMVSSILTLTTPLDDFILCFSMLKFPAEFSMMLTLALRFIPTLDKKRISVLEAQKARGAKLNEKGIVGPILSYIPIMIPMFVNSILMANSLSMAMLNRGYGFTRSRTALRKITFSPWDVVVMLMIGSVTVGAIYLRVVYHLGLL